MAYNKEYYQAYSLANRERINARRREYYKTNKEKARQYYHDNKERNKEYGKKYREDNKDYFKAYNKEYSQNNKEKIAENKKLRYHNNPHVKIRDGLRSRINIALIVGYTSDSIVEVLGCSIEEFKKYIASQFTEGMSWDNHALDGWHLDHRLPCSSFDLTDPEEQKKCFHYSNTQPLWASDNRSKGSKI